MRPRAALFSHLSSGVQGPGRNKRTGVLAMLLVLALASSGCGPEGEAFEVGRQVRLLGAVGTVDSDDPSVVGMVQATELAVDEYNGNPDSRYEIEFRQFSPDSRPGEAGAGQGDIEQTARLIGVVGPFTAEALNDLGPAFSEAELPFVVPSVSTASAPPDGVTSFRRLIAHNSQEGAALAAHAADLVAGGIVLVTEDSDPGRAFSEGAEPTLAALDRTPERVERVQPDAGMDILALALVDAAPEVVLYGGGGSTGSTLVQSLMSKGYEGRIVTSHQVKLANPDGLGTGVISSSLFADPAAAAAPGFAEAFEEAYGSAPPWFALEAYEGAWMLLEAIEEVEADSEAVNAFLQTSRSFRGESKQYEFADSGDLSSGLVWLYESDEEGWTLSGRSDSIPEKAKD